MMPAPLPDRLAPVFAAVRDEVGDPPVEMLAGPAQAEVIALMDTGPVTDGKILMMLGGLGLAIAAGISLWRLVRKMRGARAGSDAGEGRA